MTSLKATPPLSGSAWTLRSWLSTGSSDRSADAMRGTGHGSLMRLRICTGNCVDVGRHNRTTCLCSGTSMGVLEALG